MMTVVKNTLFIYGGILESSALEYTLCDFWSINLDKMVEWNPIIVDEIDTSKWKKDDSSDEESSQEEDDEEDELEMPVDTQPATITETKEDPESIPQPDETLCDFFARTVCYWQLLALSEENLKTGKSLRRDAFQTAREQWFEWQPKLAELKTFLVEQGESAESKKHTETRSERSRR